MKNKKVIYIVITIIILTTIISIIIIKNKKQELNDHTPPEAISIMDELKEKYRDKEYKQLKDKDLITENTLFNKYSFITNNSIYIFNSNKLDDGELVYKKVYDLDNSIKVMNITPSTGSDIKFYDYNDTLYTLHDNNIDNKVSDSYEMYLNANYELNDYLKWEYSKEFLGRKIDYDFMSEYVYIKDNILYRKNYGNDKYPTIEKINGNYEGEKVIRIYNERIVKTDKAFYELMTYFDTNSNKKITTTVKINNLTKYYDEVLTFTYKYVILKDYTLIPINDIMENRVRDYSYGYFIDGFNSMDEVRYEE